jgi:cytochrome c553
MKKIVFAIALFYTCAIQASENATIEEKAALCVACHGVRGISTNPEWPSIAGQHANYLLKQMSDFKKGRTRNAPMMTAILANLNGHDMAELATFYAQQPLPEGVVPKKYLKRGEQLYRGGDFDKHITACIACHGPRGTGNEQAGFPVLSGQHASYTIQQLQAFKDQRRKNDLNSIMRDISARMSLEDMTAVAYYMQGLQNFKVRK